MDRFNASRTRKDNIVKARVSDDHKKFIIELAKAECNGNESKAIELLITSYQYNSVIRDPMEQTLTSIYAAINEDSYSVEDTNKKVQILMMLVLSLLEKEGVDNSRISDYLDNDIFKKSSQILSDRINQAKNKLK